MNEDALTPLLPAYRQAIYNPGRLTDAEIRASYIARQAMFEHLLEEIDATKPGAIPQHHLLIGQRGMGKTTLLHRLDVALREEAYAPRFIPLIFPEEQWTIDRLSKLWLNCLDSLADTLEREGAVSEAITAIDEAVDRLTREHGKEDLLSEAAEKSFLELAASLGRRPVLLLDNIDLIFDRLEPHEVSRLRAFMMRAGAPVLVGACVSPPAQTSDYSAPFYDHFKTHYLERLTVDDMQDVLVRLALRAGDRELAARIEAERPRLQALHALTGGNPRTTVILFQIFTKGFSREAYQDLEALLDWMTPLYKARFEELPPQAQVVVGALATHWEPATSGQIGELTRLENKQVSPQLDRLRKAGLIEEVLVDPEDQVGPLSQGRTPQARTGFQLAERFFNIWFLMRQATRRDRRNLTFLTRFIESIHTHAERSAMARDLLGRRPLTREERIYGLALEPAGPEYGLRFELHDYVQQEMVEASRTLQERIDELIDPAEIPPHRFAFAELKSRLKKALAKGSVIAPETFADEVLGSPSLINRRNTVAGQRLTTEKAQELIDAAHEEHTLITKIAGEDAAEWFRNVLRRGTLVDLSDAGQASAAFCRADSRQKILLCARFTEPAALRSLDAAAWDNVRQLLTPKPGAPWSEWVQWADILEDNFQSYLEAEAALRKAVEIAPRSVFPWVCLGRLLLFKLDRNDEAEKALRKAIDLDPTEAKAWTQLGYLQSSRQGRYEEAEHSYRKAIELDPGFTFPWVSLGRLLYYRLRRPEEAETALRHAIQIQPEDDWAWYSLACFLRDHRKKYAQAAEAFRKAVSFDPANDSYWMGLGNLLRYELDLFNEAEEAYRRVVSINPKSDDAWVELADLLYGVLHRYADAAKAYREAVAVNPHSQAGWNGLGLLLADHFGRGQEAADALQAAFDVNPQDSVVPRYNLISVFRDHLGRMAEAKRLAAELPALADKAAASAVALHLALFAAYEKNWGVTVEHLGRALGLIADYPAIPAPVFPDWMRATAVLLHLGYGADLLGFLDGRVESQRLRPWYEAIRAHLRGDRLYLRNIPMEMREPAGLLFDQIKVRLDHLPANTRRWSAPGAKKPKARPARRY